MNLKIKINKDSLPQVTALACASVIFFVKYTYLFGGISGVFLKVVAVIGILFAVLMETKFNRKITMNSMGVFFVFLAISAISLFSDNIEVLEILSLVYVFRNTTQTKIDSALKMDIVIKMMLTVMAILGSISGLVYNRAVKGDVLSYGFSHVNRLGAILLIIAVEYWLINRAKNSALLVSFFMLAFEIFLRCRTGIILLLLLLIFQFIYFLFEKSKNFKRKNKIKKYYISLLFFVSIFTVTVSYYFMVCYDNSSVFQYRLNQLFNMRLLLSFRAFQDYDITLFGQLLEFVSSDQMSDTVRYFAIDNMFVYILFQWGLLLTSFYLFIHLVMGLHLWKRDNVLLMSILTITVLFSFIENQMIDVGVNIFLIYLGSIWRKTKNKEVINTWR